MNDDVQGMSFLCLQRIERKKERKKERKEGMEEESKTERTKGINLRNMCNQKATSHGQKRERNIFMCISSMCESNSM